MCRNEITHPLFANYEDVRILCQKILHEEGNNIFNSNEEESFALIIDMSWLWEEFVAHKLLDDFNYIHILNNGSRKGLYYSQDKAPWYPDFMENKEASERRNIVDAKYKFWNYNSGDMHQLLSYLFLTGGTSCGAVFPVDYNNEQENACIILNPYVLFYDSSIEVKCFKLPFKIPCYDANTRYEEFAGKMDQMIGVWKKEFKKQFV